MSKAQPENVEQWAAHYGVETTEFLKLLWALGMTGLIYCSLIDADTASRAWSLRKIRQAMQAPARTPVVVAIMPPSDDDPMPHVHSIMPPPDKFEP